jgi:methionyl-tRNA formyltransferase
MKKILIISDNFEICTRIKNINEKLNIDNSISYATSFYSSLEDFLKIDSNAKQYNLKEERHLNQIVENYELIFSIHSKQIFPPKLLKSCKCFNLHPGYNPINRGWYPQVFAIINNTSIGATLHEIDDYLDHGNIIDRKLVDKYSYDTSFTLYKRIVDAEIVLWEANILKILKKEYATISPEDDGNIYFKKDFNLLLNLDLNEKLSMGQLIDKLRALTFDKYDNAYFIDNLGQKIFVTINLKKSE